MDARGSNDDEAADAAEAALAIRLAELRQEHQDLDSAVRALESEPLIDFLRIARLKKRKLALKDEIARVEDMVVPDIIA